MEDIARAGDINGLYALLRQNRKLLEGVDEEPFMDSPLHVAVSFGHTDFALEILRLKPCLGKKLNPDGLSPLDLALRRGRTDTVIRLIKYDPELIRVQGREGFTPLHFASGIYYDMDLLAEFLITRPASIKGLTIRGETAVHIAVKHGRLGAVKVLLGWLQRTGNREVLNWKDKNGNAALHLSVSTNQPEMVKLLIGKVKNNEKNLEGKTALDIAEDFPEQENEQVRKILKRARVAEGSSVSTSRTLAQFLSSRPDKIHGFVMKFDIYLDKDLSGDMRNALLVVAVLITTATYQAILQPPSIVWQKDNPPSVILDGTYITNGTTVNNATITSTIDQWSQTGYNAGNPSNGFHIFLFVNSIAFAGSVGMIFALLPRNRYIFLLYMSLGFMFISYLILGFLLSPSSQLTLVAFGLFASIAEIRMLLLWPGFWSPKVYGLTRWKDPEQTDG